MRRSPLLRKTPLDGRPKTPKPKRDPWIPPRKRPDLSRMDCCPEAVARAVALVALGCACCGARDPEVHHIRRGTGTGLRAPWWRTLPLCQVHHTSGGLGIAVHGGNGPGSGMSWTSWSGSTPGCRPNCGGRKESETIVWFPSDDALH